MNEHHAKLCPSPEWAQYLQTEVLGPLTAGLELGDEMVEIGPGPGAATDWLRHRVKRLVAVEIDPEAAGKLTARYVGTNVEIVNGDASAMTFEDGSFASAASFTMLHHVPTLALQNRLLSEVFRVLRPGGVLVGSDSLASTQLHEFHEADTYNPVEPSSLLIRLQTIGFDRITVSVDHIVKWTAHKPL
jgi:SAM-dependent methyltransferase